MTVSENQKGGYLRLAQIVGPAGFLPISKSSWWAGVKSGRYPKPIKLGPRITVWSRASIEAFLDRLGESE